MLVSQFASSGDASFLKVRIFVIRGPLNPVASLWHVKVTLNIMFCIDEAS
jgi:hypothetical protein